MNITMKGEEHFANDSHANVLCFLLILLFQKRNSLSTPLISHHHHSECEGSERGREEEGAWKRDWQNQRTWRMAVPFLKLENDLMISWLIFSIDRFQSDANPRTSCWMRPEEKKEHYNRFSFNGYLYKKDTSVKRTPTIGPCLSLLSLPDSL